MKKPFDDYLIVSDLDGTFFGKPKKLLKNNLEAILDFCEKGGVFTIASGRDSLILKKIFPDAARYVSGPAILCNGAYLYDFSKDEFLFETAMDQDEFLEVLSVVTEAFPDVGYRVSFPHGFICPYMSPFMDARSKLTRPFLVHSPLSEHRGVPWYKCVFVAEPETIDKMWAFARTIPMINLFTLPSDPTLLEILPASAGKEAKFEILKSFYPGRTCVYAGDYTNDIGLLKAADIAASPENAIDEVKAITKIHLCHHRDGCIADLIEKLASRIAGAGIKE